MIRPGRRNGQIWRFFRPPSVENAKNREKTGDFVGIGAATTKELL
jgi:hypothetical protein